MRQPFSRARTFGFTGRWGEDGTANMELARLLRKAAKLLERNPDSVVLCMGTWTNYHDNVVELTLTIED